MNQIAIGLIDSKLWEVHILPYLGNRSHDTFQMIEKKKRHDLYSRKYAIQYSEHTTANTVANDVQINA